MSQNTPRRILAGSLLIGAIAIGTLVPTVAASASESTPPVIMDKIAPDAPIVDARTGDVTTPGGAAAHKGTVQCGNSVWAPIGVFYGPVSQGKCGLSGFVGYKAGYSFAQAPGSNTNACVQGQGYSGGKAKWYSIGCGTSGSSAVSWGNVLAYQKARAQSMSGLAGFLKWW